MNTRALINSTCTCTCVNSAFVMKFLVFPLAMIFLFGLTTANSNCNTVYSGWLLLPWYAVLIGQQGVACVGCHFR